MADEAAASPTKKRGRPAKSPADVQEKPKAEKRGRAPKEDKGDEGAPAAKRGRGRPKGSAKKKSKSKAKSSGGGSGRGRGRPKKKEVEEKEQSSGADDGETDD